ncbi:hypothetical protein GCM10017708_00020 [Arthrobacter citreus]
MHGVDQIDARTAGAALDMYEVDARGLDRLDRSVLRALVTKFNGGPVGLSTLAIAVGEEPETVETVAEPYLVREGLLGRTPRGRVATRAAWEHLGLQMPDNVAAGLPENMFSGPGTNTSGTNTSGADET